MRWAEFVNENEVRKAISVLQEPGGIFEVRVIGTAKKDILSGYFKDADTLFKAIDSIKLRERNVYITLAKIKTECFSRTQHEKFIQSAQTTSDTDIVAYRWLFIDLDPVRATGISSSEEELNKAKILAREVYAYLKDLGFEEPVKALSGNGCHLLYRIAVKNNEEGRDLVERCLKVLSMLFDSDEVKIDTTNYNPSRICKLHGTLAQKGSSDETRPHRMSRIFSVPDEIKITEKIFLQKLADELPREPEPAYSRKDAYRGQDFDLIDFMRRNGMTYKEDSNDRAKIFRLDECPFDNSHKDGDAKIFLYQNGAIAFKCHHNSCKRYKWQDVRLKFEPDAYDHSENDQRIDLGWQEHNRNKTVKEVPYQELTDETQMFRSAKEIYEDPEPDYEYIRSGIKVIDTKLHGLQKAGLSVISGTRGSGKSTLVGQMIITAIDDGHNVICYSGELNNKKYLRWLMRQAAGKHNIETNISGTRIKPEKELDIINWMDGHFWLYNNKYGNRFDKIEAHLREKMKEYQADLCIIDNLMALDLSEYNRDKYDAQTEFVWALKNLAEITNTHIIFVAHPKKVNGFIRLNDISGSGNIGNIVDNAFLVHRNNRDFQNGYKDMFDHEPNKDGITDDVTNVIEIAKDREYGTQDEFISLYFEKDSKRLRNDPAEYIVYGWDMDENGFSDAIDGDIPF